MARREAITATTVALDHMYHLGQRIIKIGRTQATHQRAYQGSTDLVGQRNGKSYAQQTKQHHFPTKILHHYIKNSGIHGNPYHLPLYVYIKASAHSECQPLTASSRLESKSLRAVRTSVKIISTKNYLFAMSSYSFCK